MIRGDGAIDAIKQEGFPRDRKHCVDYDKWQSSNQSATKHRNQQKQQDNISGDC